ncbi:MCE family protein [Actinocorallia longicatena]|uniref:Phospholipid/cholesterol/gamma-HCH transport system substrate-binding protein n=1 Tax=Actinocorallia longicatena TaxID=111803 RepID=A0ABP6Q591_9ACTN
MTRRVILNLVVFAVLGLVLTTWAIRNVLHFDPLSKPYVITAEFASSPGLQPNFDVTYLGVAVGTIKSVRLDGPKVVVGLSIDKGTRIPGSVHAMAGPKSAIGEPFIDLEPPAGQAGAEPLRPGATIPLDRTAVAQSYGDLFASVNKAINGLDPGNLRIVTRELALGLDGRGDSLRQTVDGASRLTRTFASDTSTLDDLIGNVATLTGVLSDHRGSLGTGITGTAQLTGALAEIDDSLRSLRDTGPGLLAKTASLLNRSDPALRCLLGTLGDSLPTLLSPKNVADLDVGLRWAPQLAPAMAGVITFVNGDPNLNLTITLTPGPVKGTKEFKTPLLLPTIPAYATCPGISTPGHKSPPITTPAGKNTPVTTQAPVTTTPSAVPITQSSDGGDDGPDTRLIYLPPLVAALILLRVAMNSFGPIARRRDRKRSRR